MAQILKYAAMFSLILSFAACSHKEDQNKQDDAQTLANEQKDLLGYFARTTIPPADSSDAQIAEYEKNANRLDSVQDQLIAMNLTHNILIGGSKSVDIIEGARQAVAAARAGKSGVSSSRSGAAASRGARSSELAAETLRLSDQYDSTPAPGASATRAEIDADIQLTEKLMSDLRQVLASGAYTTDEQGLNNSINRIQMRHNFDLVLKEMLDIQLSNPEFRNDK